MRISGGMNNCLRSDFMRHRPDRRERTGSGVTRIDSVGLALCLIAVEQYKVAVARIPRACMDGIKVRLAPSSAEQTPP
jgi:hypothetical protein